jgi:methylase of polypeptide subunit release factors
MNGLKPSLAMEIEKHFYNTEQRILYRGFEITVLPNVFVPRKISRVIGISPKNIRMYKNKEVLDMGCGTGVQSILALKAGARKIVSADINPLACQNTALNLAAHDLTAGEVRESDLFANVPEKFDSIVAYLPSINAEAHDMRERAVYDQGFETFRRFLKVARTHLNLDGIIYTCWVNIDNSISVFNEMIDQGGYKLLHSNMILYEGEEWWMFDVQ